MSALTRCEACGASERGLSPAEASRWADSHRCPQPSAQPVHGEDGVTRCPLKGCGWEYDMSARDEAFRSAMLAIHATRAGHGGPGDTTSVIPASEYRKVFVSGDGRKAPRKPKPESVRGWRSNGFTVKDRRQP